MAGDLSERLVVGRLGTIRSIMGCFRIISFKSRGWIGKGKGEGLDCILLVTKLSLIKLMFSALYRGRDQSSARIIAFGKD